MKRREFNRLTGLAAAGMFLPGCAGRAAGRRIKIGQIGASHSHAEGKLETILALDSIFEFAGIAEDDPVSRRLAESIPMFNRNGWLSEAELLKTPGLQAVAVETAPDDLIPAALRSVEKGLHVHVDKPPGRSLPALRALLIAASDRSLVAQMGYMFRYNPAFIFCMEAVRSGLLGRLFEVDGVISKAVSPERRYALIKEYGGAMMLLGCHLIDMVVALCGKPEKVTGFNRRTTREKDELSDNELAVLEYPGITATVRSSLIEVEGQHRRQFVVCGSKGTIEIRPLEPAQVVLSLDEDRGSYKKGRHTVELPPAGSRYEAQLTDFARMIRGRRSNRFSLQHELDVQEALLTAAGFPLNE